jgi:Cd2+/Zn2+-exporting ATPase
VIATPATILSALASAARHGVLFKGGRFIETLGRVKAVAFDKTGTLTRGRFEVTEVEALDSASAEDVLRWAAGAESRSQHPLARAVVRAAAARGQFVPAHGSDPPGKGLVATRGRAVEVGTPSCSPPRRQAPAARLNASRSPRGRTRCWRRGAPGA